MRDYTTMRVKGRSVASALLLVLPVAACGEPTVSSDKITAPLSIHDMLVDCAGAIAAEGNIDPLVEPSTGSREENALWTVLALMDKEPGLFGAAGREAAALSKAAWQMKSGPGRTARAAECMQRFGGG
jgi:hypothetical protein